MPPECPDGEPTAERLHAPSVDLVTVAPTPAPSDRRVSVVVVDDATEIRRLLRALLERDDRFEVVGEGSDGIEAVGLAASLSPDLLLLDRHMPRLGGLEALPELARFAPRTNVILFTASTNAGTYHAAISAGALDVIEKSVASDFVDRLAQTLVDHWAHADATVRMHIGPVSSASARLWIANTRRIVSALRLHPEIMGEAPPTEVLDIFNRFLQLWEEASEGREEFSWAARARFSEVAQVVEWWARVDAMTDEQVSAARRGVVGTRGSALLPRPHAGSPRRPRSARRQPGAREGTAPAVDHRGLTAADTRGADGGAERGRCLHAG